MTDDRQPNPRRRRKLTVEQIFAASYLMYPKYFDYSTKKYVNFEDAVDILLEMKRSQSEALVDDSAS